MEGVLLKQFNKIKPPTIPLEKSNYHLSDESDQDASTTATHHHIILQFIVSKGFTIFSFTNHVGPHIWFCKVI